MAPDSSIVHRDKSAADITNEVGVDNQDGHHEHNGKKPRGHKILSRTGRHDAQGIDLFRDLHRADFSSNGGPDPTGHNDTGKNGCKLAGHGDGHNAADGISRTKTDKFLCCLNG